MIRIVLMLGAASVLNALPLRAKLLTLADAERMAVEHSYATRLNALEERSKEWEKRKTVAGYLPSVTYALNYLRMDEQTVEDANAGTDAMIGFLQSMVPGMEMENYNELYENSFSHEISVTQPITNGGAEYFAIQIAKRTKNAVELQQQAAVQQAVHETRKAYYDAVASRERTLVARQSLEWVELNLAGARSRYEAGTVPYTDVLQWEAEMAGRLSDIASGEAAERLMVLSLFQALGKPVRDNDNGISLEPVERFIGQTEDKALQMDRDVEDGPQLRAVRAFTDAAKGYKDISISSFLPSLNAFYTVSWPAWDELTPQSERRGWTAGIAASVPLFSSFKNYSGYKQASFTYDKTVLETEQAAEGMRLNLERIRLFHTAAAEGLKAAQKQLELMERQMEIMQQRYDGGLVNQSVLLEVGLARDGARIGYVTKLFDLLILESEYQLAVGDVEVK